MTRFIVSRVLQAIPTFLIGMAVVVFAVRLIPGDELTQLIGEQVVNPQDRAALKHELGLDKSPVQQYGAVLLGLSHGDFGHGTFDKKPVLEKIKQRLPVTLELTILAGISSILIGVPIGVICAIWRNSPLDYALRVLGMLCLSIPSFWLASISLVLLAIYFDWTPAVTQTSFIRGPIPNLQQFFLPSLLLGAVLAGSLMRFTRSMMLEVLSEDYVRTARAKGLRNRTVVIRHALRNALIPIVTVVGLQTAAVLGGTIVIEAVFGLPGIGTLFISSLNNRDYPVIQGLNAFLLLIVIGINLLIDLSYVLLDPRVKQTYVR